MAAPTHRFFAPTWMKVGCVFAVVAFPLASYIIYVANGFTWLFAATLALASVALAGAFDAFTSKVEIYPEHLVVVANLRRREYGRSQFVSVSAAKGVPITLQLQSGGNLELPPVGKNTQGMANSLRAWLRKSGANAT